MVFNYGGMLLGTTDRACIKDLYMHKNAVVISMFTIMTDAGCNESLQGHLKVHLSLQM